MFIRFCLFWKKENKLIAADLSKQKALDADPKAVQQIIFTGKIKATEANARTIIYYILEKSKKNKIRIFQRNKKSSAISINGWIQPSKS